METDCEDMLIFILYGRTNFLIALKRILQAITAIYLANVLIPLPQGYVNYFQQLERNKPSFAK
jgi:hypothetical protein